MHPKATGLSSDFFFPLNPQHPDCESKHSGPHGAGAYSPLCPFSDASAVFQLHFSFTEFH